MSKEADGAPDADPSPDPAKPTNEETGSGGFSHCPSTQLVSGRGLEPKLPHSEFTPATGFSRSLPCLGLGEGKF